MRVVFNIDVVFLLILLSMLDEILQNKKKKSKYSNKGSWTQL